MTVIELDNRRACHLLAACAILLLAPLSLACQVTGADSTGGRDSTISGKWKPGIQIRSVQFDMTIYPVENIKGLSADIDVLALHSRPPYAFGIRAGGELVQSTGMYDYSYEMIIGNLLGRMSVLDKWARLDLYGGYAFISRTTGGFLEPGGDPDPPPRIHHTLKLGAEARIYLVPRVLALLIKYSSAIEHPFSDRARIFEMGGIGGVIGWQW